MISHPLRSILLAAGAWLACTASQAETVLITTIGSGTESTDADGIYGLVFQLDADITVRSVGFYDRGGDGLATAHRVGFGSGSSADVWPFAQATVPSGTEAALSDGFRWVNLETPITLLAGTYYTVAGEVLRAEMLYWATTQRTSAWRPSSRPARPATAAWRDLEHESFAGEQPFFPRGKYFRRREFQR